MPLQSKELWPHQAGIVARLLAGHHLMAWEPGCGKTLPALVAAACLTQPTLYICPASLRLQVEDAARQTHMNPQAILSGKTVIDPAADLVVVSYDQACDPVRWKDLMSRQWGALILDEAHYIKNSQSKRARGIYGQRVGSPGALINRAQRVWALTGTPVLNDPTELWGHVSRLYPEALEKVGVQNSKQWMGRYCHVQETVYGPRILGGKNLDELNQLLKGFMSRLTKAEVMPDLPELIIDELRIPPQLVKMDDLPEDALAALETLMANGADADALEGLAVPLATLRRRIGLAKMLHAADFIKEELVVSPDRKILVFFIHSDVGKNLEDALKRFNPVRVDGQTGPHRRNHNVKRFVEKPECRVFIGQLTATGVGLNLQAADRVILVEAAWTPALNEQAIARAHRGGQRNSVHATFVSLAGSVDEAVMGTLRKKAAMVKQIMGDK